MELIKKNFIMKGSLYTLLYKETHTQTSVRVSKSFIDRVKDNHMASTFFFMLSSDEEM